MNTYPELTDQAWLFDKYISNSLSGQAIADLVGSTKYAVYYYLKLYGIKRRKHSSRYPKLNDKEWLYNEYINNHKSIRQISIELGATVGNVASALYVMGIDTRDYKESLKLRYPEGRYGAISSNWRNGISTVARNIRSCKQYKIWRDHIISRDGHVCKLCGKYGNEVDHIKTFASIITEYSITDNKAASKCKELWDTNNGRVLCKECNLKRIRVNQ